MDQANTVAKILAGHSVHIDSIHIMSGTLHITMYGIYIVVYLCPPANPPVGVECMKHTKSHLHRLKIHPL